MQKQITKFKNQLIYYFKMPNQDVLQRIKIKKPFKVIKKSEINHELNLNFLIFLSVNQFLKKYIKLIKKILLKN